MKLSKNIAIICEGAAEEAIIDILLDNHLLIFERDNMLENEVIRTRSARSLEINHLRMCFDEKISIIRILDSRKENFRLSKAYQNNIDVINIVTAPEIEMLIILNERKYKEYKHSKKKPSTYCKDYFKLHNIKSYDFVKEYFSDVNDLIFAINEYARISKINSNEYTLKDLLKNNIHEV